MKRCVWLIAGPTASGKSALALRLAEAIGGEIVNADSMQLYADLRLLSARPSQADTAGAPHHLYGVVDGADGWSVGRWLRAATQTLAQIAQRDRTAIVVGGTGLYFRALTQGLADIPEIPADTRSAVDALWTRDGETAVRSALRAGDPLSEARIAPGDRQRLVRALAVLRATGQSLTAWQVETPPFLNAGDWRGVVIEPPRPELYARCDRRLLAMVEAGAVEEAGALAARNLDPSLPVWKAVGVQAFTRYLSGQIPKDVAIAEAQQATRNYAKRQLTWFRNQTPDWPRVTALDPDAAWSLFRSGEP